MAEWSGVSYARNGDVSIAYRTGGEGPLDLLFIPGFVSHLELLFEHPAGRAFFDRLASFSRVILFDKRGMGLSDRDRGAYTLENVVSDAVAVLDAAGSERAALFGVSEGGPASIMIAAIHPERLHSLLLYGTYARVTEADDYPEGVPLETLRAFWADLAEHWAEPAGLRAFAPSAGDDEEFREFWARFLRSAISPGMVEKLATMYEDLDVRPLLGSIATPSLVLYRSGDRLVPPHISMTIAEGIPEARAVELPGDDHLFFAGDQDPLLGEVEEFLTGRPRTAAAARALATVMFTDLVDSTATAAELGDGRWRELLVRFHRLAGREVERHGGRLVKTTGDGMLATFDGPAQAIRAARTIADVARDCGVRTRSGIHTGECELIGEDIGGIAVHIASRVEGLAEPGQVATTGTVADLVVGSGLEFRELGSHELKGVPGEWRLCAVAGDAEAA